MNYDTTKTIQATIGLPKDWGIMITKNCMLPRCMINGEINMGSCKCEMPSKFINPKTILAGIEDDTIRVDTIEEANELIAKISHLQFNDRVYKVINNFLQRTHERIANGHNGKELEVQG